jgi:hypothetical protein
MTQQNQFTFRCSCGGFFGGAGGRWGGGDDTSFFCGSFSFGDVSSFRGFAGGAFDGVDTLSQPRAVRFSPVGHGDWVVGAGVFTGVSRMQVPFGPRTSPEGQAAGTVHLPSTMI